jgi:hypothetical protein
MHILNTGGSIPALAFNDVSAGIPYSLTALSVDKASNLFEVVKLTLVSTGRRSSADKKLELQQQEGTVVVLPNMFWSP